MFKPIISVLKFIAVEVLIPIAMEKVASRIMKTGNKLNEKKAF